MKTIALLTYAALPELIADDHRAVAALQSIGIQAQPVVWDSKDIDPTRFEALIIRSCWDYHLRSAEFMDTLQGWAEQGARLWNPLPLVHWNHAKTYIRDLARDGALVPPTLWLEAGTTADLGQTLLERGWEQAVVKPAVSANAHHTWRTSPAQAAAQQTQFQQVLQTGGVLVQQYVEEITTGGEWSFLYFGGQFSHAVVKRPKSGDFRVQEGYGGSSAPAEPPAHLLAEADKIAALLPQPWLYARVDGIESAGRFLLMEVELIEPSLFLASHPAAASNFAQAVQRMLGP